MSDSGENAMCGDVQVRGLSNSAESVTGLGCGGKRVICTTMAGYEKTGTRRFRFSFSCERGELNPHEHTLTAT